MRHRFFVVGSLLVLAASVAQATECTTLVHMKLDHTTVTAAAIVAAGVPLTPANSDPLPPAAFDYCRVQLTAKPTADSDIRIEVWIPSGGAWNGKFEQLGNGGFAGSVPYRSLSHVLSLGYAVAGTDDGHQSDEMTDASWALNHPEKIKDFGWRAVQETTLLAKRIIHELTAKTPAKSYFVGCSDGGREALMMAQRYPTYFDGIVAGAPAYSMTQLMTGGALRSLALNGSVSHLPPPQLALLQHQALQQCGNGAPYLKDPRQCHPDVEALRCTAAGTEVCLSDAQIKTVRVLYADRKDPANGDTLYGVLPGAEAVKGSWDAWLTGIDDKTPAAGMAFSWNYVAYWVMHDPKLDPATISDADLIRGEREFAPIIDAKSADLSAFKLHGGKLIQYHGWNDPGIAPGFSLEYRARIAAKTGDLAEFYRLYMIPGMLHCAGGDAPTLVNWQAALEAWVEKSQAPQDLLAGDGHGTTQTLRSE